MAKKLFAYFAFIITLFSLTFSFLFPAVVGNAQGARLNGAGIGITPAKSDPNNSLTRAWFIESIKPGETVERTALVTNASDEDKTIQVAGEDRIKNSADFSYTDKEEVQEVGKWISLDAQEITVPARRSAEVKFKISVPEGTASGEYAGVVAIQEKKADSNSSGFKVVSRIGARIYITVPGDLSVGTKFNKFEFITPKSSNFETYVQENRSQPFDTLFLAMNFENTGNVFEKLDGKIDITGPKGTVTQTFNRDFPSFDNAFDLKYQKTDAKWVPGKYKAVFTFANRPVIGNNKTDVKDKTETKEVTTEFEMTQEMLDQMQTAFKKAVEEGPKAAPADNTKKQTEGTLEIKEKEEVKTEKQDLTLVYVLGGVIVVLLLGIIGYLVYREVSKRKAAKKTEGDEVAQTPVSTEVSETASTEDAAAKASKTTKKK